MKTVGMKMAKEQRKLCHVFTEESTVCCALFCVDGGKGDRGETEKGKY